MSKATENSFKKNDYEILFIDSPEYFVIENARFIQEGKFARFLCFDKNNVYSHTIWHPINRIHRIKTYKS